MTYRYPGGLVRRTAANTSITGASGVWDLGSQAQAVKTNTWPISGLANPVSGSLRFRASATAYLTRTGSTATNAKLATYSFWFKRGALTTGQWLFTGGTTVSLIGFNGSSDSLSVLGSDTSGEGNITSAVFRDSSAWYHVVIAIDTAQATTADRAKIYVNGVQQAVTVSNGGIGSNSNWGFNTAGSLAIGRYSPVPGSYTDGYMSEVYFVDGQALTPSSFGQTSPITGVWEPIKYTGTYGTNGFYLSLSDTSSIGKDFSGNGNNWTPNNISTANDTTFDLMRDVPTQWAPQGVTDVGGTVRGNYCTLNPLDAQGTATLSGANLTLASSSATHRNRKATFIVPSTGKWYWELTTASTCSSSVILGWGLQTTAAATDSQAGNANTFMAQNDANQDIWNQTTSVLSTGSAVAANAIRQVAYDADTGKIWFGINNTWYSSTDLTSGNPSAGTNQCLTLSAGSYFPTITCYNLTANANFGQRPFAYTPPTGFKSLCTTNLPTPTIGATTATAANKNFDATLYTGNDTGQSVINAGAFQPSLIWYKARSAAYYNTLIDDIRGAGTRLFSNLTDGESNDGIMTSFNTNGFTLGANSGEGINKNAVTYVAWQWKGATSNATNTSGSITSNVRANQTAGFSIATWTGQTSGSATIGHGLGVAPSVVLVKGRNDPGQWWMYHSAMGNTKFIWLNNIGGSQTGSGTNAFADTAPTSSVFTVGTSFSSSSPIVNWVAYCFAPIAGYSAFGSYTGNGSTDGPFIYTGFRPRFVMFKRTTNDDPWIIHDTARDIYNGYSVQLYPNASSAEGGPYSPPIIDELSNGFKCRSSASGTNGSGDTFIYMAFAEFPFKNSLAR